MAADTEDAAMTGKIVDIIPETQPQTSGQK
jgi:hypothetical protein